MATAATKLVLSGKYIGMDSAVTFAPEVLTVDFIGEAWPLLTAHKDEVAHFEDIPLEPDVDAYLEKQRLGAIRLFTARKYPAVWYTSDVSRAAPLDLIGYAVFVVAPNAHYVSSLQAMQDVLYIAPEYRKGTGREFIAYCEDRLREEGVQAIYQHLKAKHDHPGTMAALGYELVDHVYTKRLDR